MIYIYRGPPQSWTFSFMVKKSEGKECKTEQKLFAEALSRKIALFSILTALR